jgi:hypothetical protein
MLDEGMPAGANGLALGPTRTQLLNKDPRDRERPTNVAR